MNDVKSNLIASIAKFTEEEDLAQANHDKDIANKKAEINRMVIERTEASASLTRTNEQISSS
jgi:hypothetical protein